MNDKIDLVSDIIKKSKTMVALTGAGISVASGIPDFRSSGGLWEKYDPEIYASIYSFKKMPEKVWDMIFELIDMTKKAKPNAAHYFMAKLEDMNKLKAVITQNIDNLHQEAGSKVVIEYHGNAQRLICLYCSEEYNSDDFKIEQKQIPLCKNCGKILKPSVVFFGETIPHDALYKSQKYAENADVVLVVGTSAVVYPAADIPRIAKSKGAKIIEFNIEKTDLTSGITDVFIQGFAEKTLTTLLKKLRK